MSYESKLLEELERSDYMYKIGVTNGKSLALSMLEIRLLDSGVIATGKLFDVIAELRTEFTKELVEGVSK